MVRGRFRGSAYRLTRRTSSTSSSWVLDQARVHVAGDGSSGAMDVTAGAFGEARRDRRVDAEPRRPLRRELHRNR